MASTMQVGWELEQQPLAIKQGSSGAIQLQCLLSNDDGVIYDGWTCRIAFRSPYTGGIVISLTPDVTGNAGDKTLTAVMAFVPETTASLTPGTYLGDAKFTAPDPSTDQYFSVDLSLAIESSAA